MQKTLRKPVLLMLVFALLIAIVPSQSAEAAGTRMSGLEARDKVTDRFGGVIQKIEYNYDDHDPLYKGEALRNGRKLTFEINARTGRWEKYEIDGSNEYRKFSPYLSRLVSMNKAAEIVIARSGRKNTVIMKIDFDWDRSKPMYKGEAYYGNTKISFEMNAYTGRFYKYEVDRGDDTYYEELWNIRPDYLAK